MSSGIHEYPELLAALPIPGKELRERVNNPDEQLFVESGLSDAQNLFLGLSEGGFDPARHGSLLDFGCGCGRILRLAARLDESCELHGCDVDAECIAWCRENLPFARFENLAPRPPAPYPDERFDAAYAFSIFTHLPEQLHRDWLGDLHRILRPGGILVVTTAGRRSVEKFISGEVLGGLDRPTPEQLRADLPRLDGHGFLYYSLAAPSPSMPEAERGADLYGMTFLTEGYIRARWLDLYELVSFHEAPQDWQDYVVLRRRPGG